MESAAWMGDDEIAKNGSMITRYKCKRTGDIAVIAEVSQSFGEPHVSIITNRKGAALKKIQLSEFFNQYVIA